MFGTSYIIGDKTFRQKKGHVSFRRPFLEGFTASS